ncbi:cell division protein ZipA C-terminal FtsZ-binding domain-containing protein [Aquabacterium sp.]|uniref:cell division protein ZipA C-terminal FtsZ-binding domain-containing protein n=1 Tax=Aquabacterium sp. TaxID=1872578 RepID=UPI002C954C02|nr:cell division protein ZipA C-terminal FtsZ-binding domain-containing protein [Aquabacterium sp.]HSW04775.1 cell division protein ZipA C-terminal FtsZ-binding domain-containing protein [Aquabacterium sp.]
MSLMAALAVLGGLILAAVIAHGAWSARKASPRQPEGLADKGRVEPVLGDQPPTAATEASALTELRTVLPRKPSARLDPLIDAIAPITLEAPVSGELALTHLPPSRRAGTKPFLIEGLNAESGEWELPASGQRYGEFQAGVQMANRSGALNQIEFSEFVQKLQDFSEGVGGMVEVPDMLDVVARAREIDAFASEHDAQLAVTLRANGAAWSVGYLQQCASRRGFVPGVLPGRLVLPSADEGAPPVLVLSFDAQAALAEDPHIAAVRQVSLSLDVPQTPEAAEPFPTWHDTARNLAADMDATMVDDQGRLITLHAFAAIGTDLQTLYRALESRDLAAGSAAARRVFN